MKIYILIFFIISIFSELSKGVEGLEKEEIITNNEAQEGEYGYQISLQKDGIHICGGAIVHEQFIVTAAHCVIEPETNEFIKESLIIVAGAINIYELNSYTVSVRVIEIYVFAVYNTRLRRSDGDISVLKLEHGLNLSVNTHLLKLEIGRGFFLSPDMPLVITGHGFDSIMLDVNTKSNSLEEIGMSGGILRYAAVELVNNEKCNRFYNFTILPTNVCGKIGNSDADYPMGTCGGDSGSPLVYNSNILIGVLSLGPIGCDESNIPAVYTAASFFWSFITTILEGHVNSNIRIAKWQMVNPLRSAYAFVET